MIERWRESKLCRSDKRDIYPGNEMTKSEQQTFRRYYARIFAWKRVDERPLYAVRAPLIVKNSQEKVGVRRHTFNALARRWLDLSDLIFAFFFLLYPTTAVLPRFPNSKKSFVHPRRYRAFFLQRIALENIKILGYRWKFHRRERHFPQDNEVKC